MKNLIKNILREFVENKKISIEVIGNLGGYDIEIIRESVEYHDFEGEYDDDVKEKIIEYHNELVNYAQSKSPFFGYFEDKYTKSITQIEFDFVVGQHFVERLFRKFDKRYNYPENIETPGLFDAVDILVANADILARDIALKKITHNDVVKITNKWGDTYKFLVTFSLKDKKNKIWYLYLFNQIKGPDTGFNKFDKELFVSKKPK